MVCDSWLKFQVENKESPSKKDQRDLLEVHLPPVAAEG